GAIACLLTHLTNRTNLRYVSPRMMRKRASVTSTLLARPRVKSAPKPARPSREEYQHARQLVAMGRRSHPRRRHIPRAATACGGLPRLAAGPSGRRTTRILLIWLA